MSRRGVDAHDTRKVIHSPKVVIHRDRAVLMTSEPLCDAPIGPGKTTSVDAKVSCQDCLRLRGES